MASNQAVEKKTAPRIPIRRRVKAWWDGEELSLRQKTSEQAVEGSSDHQEIDYYQFLQDLWGPEADQPSDPQYIAFFLKPLGLDPSMTVINLGSGFGAMARAIAADYGAWVIGLEEDKTLVELGNKMSEKAGLAKKAEIRPFEINNYDFRPNYADCVVTREFLHKQPGKDEMLSCLYRHLKDYGQLLFTDFVLADDVEPADLADIPGFRGEHTELWRAEKWASYLEERQFDLRINEDVTEDYLKVATQAWAAFMGTNKAGKYGPETQKLLTAQLDMWTSRLQVFRTGKLKVHRFHCIKALRI